ncbi:MAG: N-acetyltransferase family protein [Marinifilaceae bacterium]|jgi:phosphinothricin acetyltransferase
MEYIIRRAEGVDLSAINTIYNQAVPLIAATADMEQVPLSRRKVWFEEHQRNGNPILVAENNGVVVGWLSFSYYREGRKAVAQVREISYYIHEDYREKGVASSLIEKSIKMAPEVGAEVLITFIIDGNEGSIRLMNKFGFELWGRLPKVVNVSSEDVRDHLIFGLRCS